MRILHCCLAAFYIDNYSYQENILPKLHSLQGNEVFIIASTETYVQKTKLGYVSPSEYINENGISVKRIPYINWLPQAMVRKLRMYAGLYKAIENVKPDIIYLHDCQFLSITSIASYAKRHNVKIIIDSHTDLINSGTSFLSYYVLHKFIYKFCVKYIEKYTSIFWGTLPLREDFLHEMYGVSRRKIGLLPFGTDDTLYNRGDAGIIRKLFRNEHHIHENDFVIITGGKIDKRKNIILLIKSFLDFVEKKRLTHVKLLIFGQPTDELRSEFDALISEQKNIIYLKWLESKEIHQAFFASDLAFFPGTHSVLWEEAAGIGIPAVYLKWKGITHVDVGGNCIFMDEATPEEISDILNTVCLDREVYARMNAAAKKYGPANFSYTDIAKKAINI